MNIGELLDHLEEKGLIEFTDGPDREISAEILTLGIDYEAPLDHVEGKTPDELFNEAKDAAFEAALGVLGHASSRTLALLARGWPDEKARHVVNDAAAYVMEVRNATADRRESACAD